LLSSTQIAQSLT